MSTAAPIYPVRVEGRLEPRLSRWLWLFKWLLAIPHYIVLAFLGLAFVVLTAIAFVAILFTGRYPRGIFDFNVGVLRWWWRVAFYSYSALGTDRYPPFTLDPVPDYPADLEIEYPTHLRRGLPLIGWWLAGIPHYVIVGLLAGGGWLGMQWGEHWLYRGSWGLIGVLVCVAAVVLLFTGRYPQQLFDLILGFNRWVLRVAAYAALMTREYPPFRLDVGGSDPGGATLVFEPVAAPVGEETAAPPVSEAAVAAPAAAPAPARAVPRMTAGRVVALVLGSLGLLVSLAVVAAGGVSVWADQTQRDSAGFLMSPTDRISTSTFAITTDFRKTSNALATDVLDTKIEGPSWLFASSRFGTVRVHAQSLTGKPIFIGVGPTATVARFLEGVRHEEISGYSGGSPTYRLLDGTKAATKPAAQDFWIASASGTGAQAVSWNVSNGNWTIVAMNADGTSGLDAEVSLGAKLSFLLWLGIGLLAVGGVMLVGATALVAFGARSRRAA